jgi:glycosyltransferase involved in cell wall biosynthesis
VEKRILFLSKGEHSPSTRYRAFNYFPYFQNRGWLPEHLSVRGSLADKLKLLRQARKADVVVVLRHAFDFPMLPLLRRASKRLIFDFDDAIFVKSDGNPSKGRARRFRHMLENCDQVWSGNQYLADTASQFNSHVTVVPTAIDLDRYQIEAVKPTDHIDLVWIGSSSTSRYLKDLVPTLEKCALEVPNLRLKIIADFELQSEILTIKNIPWSHDTEVHELASAHIGIAPMTDNNWTRGKCALKVLQYMACRLPVISSASGANQEIIQHNGSGLLATNEDEWISALARLANSESERNVMGATGAELCHRFFSQEVIARTMFEQISRY